MDEGLRSITSYSNIGANHAKGEITFVGLKAFFVHPHAQLIGTNINFFKVTFGLANHRPSV